MTIGKSDLSSLLAVNNDLKLIEPDIYSVFSNNNQLGMSAKYDVKGNMAFIYYGSNTK